MSRTKEIKLYEGMHYRLVFIFREIGLLPIITGIIPCLNIKKKRFMIDIIQIYYTCYIAADFLVYIHVL